MPKQAEPMSHDRNLSHGDGFNLLYAGISGLACCLLPFLRINFGVGAFHPGGLIACAFMLCYAGFGDCPHEMLVFFCLWFPLILVHRARTLWREFHGDGEHSRYDGTPWLAMAVTRLDLRHEIAVKMAADPLIALLAGLLLSAFSPKLGLFVIACAAAILAREVIGTLIEQAHDRAQRDAEILFRTRARRRRGEW